MIVEIHKHVSTGENQTSIMVRGLIEIMSGETGQVSVVQK